MKWIVDKSSRTQGADLAGQLNLSPLAGALLFRRGIRDKQSAAAFLNPSLKDLPSPDLLPDMMPAVERIIKAIEDDQQITVYGDYDADGLTSTALLTHFLTSLGARVDNYIPHRLKEGYGLNKDAVSGLADLGTRLIITVDCGMSGHDAVALANERGLDVVITDHHKPPPNLPDALAVVNPKRKGTDPVLSGLAGVGVAFFLAAGIRQKMREAGIFNLNNQPAIATYLGLVALGTVADVAPVGGVNRVLVKEGLKHLDNSTWPGLKALKEVSALDGGLPLSARDIGFRMAPRINAAGRLDSPHKVLELLLAEDGHQADGLATYLDEQNSLRKKVQQKIIRQAQDMLEEEDQVGRHFVVLAGEGWHRGVIGIAASRIVEVTGRPAILLAIEDGKAIGSGRSIEGFNLFEALSRVSDMLDQFGGHDQAAGLRLDASRLPDLAQALEAIAAETLTEDDFEPRLEIDAFIEEDDLKQQLFDELELLAPFGNGNPEPTFGLEGLKVLSASVVGKNHLKLRLKKGARTLDTIGFGLGEMLTDLGPEITAAVRPLTNFYRGKVDRGWQVVDIKTGMSPLDP